MQLIIWLLEISGMTLDQLCIWLCVLAVVIGVPLVICIVFQIRRPTPIEDLMRDRHFGGV